MYQPTRYEILLYGPHPKGPLLVCYHTARSRSALIRTMRSMREAIERICGQDAWVTGEKASEGITIGEKWLCRFSGRTQREARDNPRPFIGEDKL